MEQTFFMYKDLPLVRCGNEIYYGNMSDPFVVRMKIQHEKEENGMKIADDIKVYLMSTREKNPVKAIIKTSDRTSLYEAVDVARVWLTRSGDEEKTSSNNKSNKK